MSREIGEGEAMSLSVQQCAERSDELHKALALHLETVEHDGTARSHLTNLMCSIAIEHGTSLRVLVSLENLTSAIALLRVQFEAVIRAIWLHYAATEQSISKVAALISSGSLKEPASAPGVPDMLKAIETTAPPAVVKMLRDLRKL